MTVKLQEDPRLTWSPEYRLNNYQVILNTPQIDLRNVKTNSTTKGRKKPH